MKPSPRFLDIIYTFNDNAFRKLNNTNLEKRDRNEFFRFSREFRQWQKDMNLEGLKKQAAIELVKENTQKQLRQAHTNGEGEGRGKDKIKRKFDKKKKSIHELKPVSQENAGKPTSPRTEKRKSVEKNGKSGSQNNLEDSKKKVAIKSVKEHTQKQCREAHPNGEGKGRAKNTIKRKFDKKKQSIHELKPASQENDGEPTSPPTEKRKSIEKNESSASHPAGSNK